MEVSCRGTESGRSVDKLSFRLLSQTETGVDEPLTGSEKRLMRRILAKSDVRHIRTMIEAKHPIVTPGLEARKDGILRDFKDTVFRGRVWPNPPKRGPNGEAQIELKPGTEPKKQRPIHMAGERREAFLNLTKDWLTDQKIEPGVGLGLVRASAWRRKVGSGGG